MSQTQQVELVAEKRTVLGKQVSQLRRQGQTPGVMYGHSFDPVLLQFETHSLQHLLSQVRGSQLIGIKIAGQEQPEMALVREVQRDPIRRDVLHVDFYRVRMTERLTAEVPLEMVGVSPVIQRNDGILLQGISEIEVECLPGNLVDAIKVDISILAELDQAIYVRDLAIPAGIEILTSLNEMIVRVVPLEEEELEELVVPEIVEVELVKPVRAEQEEEEEE